MNGLAPPDHHIPEYGSQRLFGTDRWYAACYRIRKDWVNPT